ncbi:MAG: rod shape-determining protein MreC [Clostridiales Family XIII bacterium]|jgi:rod shape-determining protein MreC|nr:rod shape-determining protein MreC [Clostridiales Family XIII bacterium]
MRWIREHRLATAILVAFAALFLLIFVSRQTLGDDNPLGRAVGEALSAVEAPFAAVGGFFGGNLSVLLDRGDLAQENERLRERVMELEKALTEARLSATDLDELKRLSELLNYSGLREKYDTVAADVIAMDASNVFNIFTINAGTRDGVFTDAVVVDGDGLIGRVMSVGDRWAKVISVIDESNKVGFQVFRSPEWLGVLQGDGEGSLKGYMLDEAAAVREGDRLITSGIGGIYPQGITIGKVVAVNWDHDTPLKTIEVEPAAYFKNIRKVSVLLAERPQEVAEP